jgi:hypothetical protein
MSTVVLDTITGKSTATTITIGSTPVVSASANSMTIRGEGTAQTSIQQGLAKALGNYSPATSASITDSFNISGITDGGTGEQDMTFTSAMSNNDYSSPLGVETTNTQDTGGSVRLVSVHSKTTLLIDARADYVTSGGLYAGGIESSVFYNMTTQGDLA